MPVVIIHPAGAVTTAAIEAHAAGLCQRLRLSGLRVRVYGGRKVSYVLDDADAARLRELHDAVVARWGDVGETTAE